MIVKLSYSLNVQINHVQRASLADVDAVYTHEGIGDGLATVGGDGVGDVVGYYFHAHAAFNADAVAVLAAFDGYSV